MKLEFDSVEDLAHFLNWAYTSRGLPDVLLSEREDVAVERGVAAADDTPLPTIDTSGIAFDTPPESGCDPVIEAAKEPAGKAPDRAAEPVKRKRRTKAEIEADEKAVAAVTEAKAAGGHVDVSRTVNADGTVSTISVGLPPDVSPSDVTAAEPASQPEGTNPFEHAAGPAAEAVGDEDGEAAVVTPFQHIVRGREFIAKHGMPKYNETFTKAGLDANVMAYTGYQRALHMTALDELDKG